MKKNLKYCVIGSGSWATAIIKILSENLREINWYVRNKNNIDYPRDLKEVRVSKPYNMDLEDIFTTTIKGARGGTTKQPMLALPEMAKAITDSTVLMDIFLKVPFFKSALAVKTAVQMNKTVLSVMTQMRNITTAAAFALSNGHMGVGASVADNFEMMLKEMLGKTKNPEEYRKIIQEISCPILEFY